jgi:hypothetical protein
MDVEVKSEKNQPYLKDHEVKELIKKKPGRGPKCKRHDCTEKYAACLVCRAAFFKSGI